MPTELTSEGIVHGVNASRRQCTCRDIIIALAREIQRKVIRVLMRSQTALK
jgi:hypothetical protein